MSFVEELRQKGACLEGVLWVRENNIQSPAEAWDKLHRSDWMLWLLEKYQVAVADNVWRRIACRCVRETPFGDGYTVWDLLDDERSRNVVEIAERYTVGDATEAELSAAQDAAWAAELDADWTTQSVVRAEQMAVRAAALTASHMRVARALGLATQAAALAGGGHWAKHDEGMAEARETQATILRECLSNPFAEGVDPQA
jgi:hypothetical protein